MFSSAASPSGRDCDATTWQVVLTTISRIVLLAIVLSSGCGGSTAARGEPVAAATVTAMAERSPPSAPLDTRADAGGVPAGETSDASRCAEIHNTLAGIADASTTVRLVVWSDGLRCLASAPVRDKDALQREARRLADSGVQRALLLVDGSVPYGPLIEILDDLLSAGIPDIVFGVSTRD
jgi:hypothetical protein